jgi:hypothetical protein
LKYSICTVEVGSTILIRGCAAAEATTTTRSIFIFIQTHGTERVLFPMVAARVRSRAASAGLSDVRSSSITSTLSFSRSFAISSFSLKLRHGGVELAALPAA